MPRHFLRRSYGRRPVCEAGPDGKDGLGRRERGHVWAGLQECLGGEIWGRGGYARDPVGIDLPETARVPSGAHTGVVTVTTGATTLTSPQTYKVKPKITSLTPTSGRATTLATIAGSGLVHATAVKFGEVGHAGDSRCASRSRGRSSGDLDRNPERNCRQPDEVHGALRGTHSF